MWKYTAHIITQLPGSYKIAQLSKKGIQFKLELLNPSNAGGYIG